MDEPSDPVPQTACYPTGGAKSMGFCLDGAMHGARELFRSDGTVMRTGHVDRGRQVGARRTFDRSGRLVKEPDFGEVPPAASDSALSHDGIGE